MNLDNSWAIEENVGRTEMNYHTLASVEKWEAVAALLHPN
jgi:hypothetical protein